MTSKTNTERLGVNALATFLAYNEDNGRTMTNAHALARSMDEDWYCGSDERTPANIIKRYEDFVRETYPMASRTVALVSAKEARTVKGWHAARRADNRAAFAAKCGHDVPAIKV